MRKVGGLPNSEQEKKENERERERVSLENESKNMRRISKLKDSIVVG